MKYQVTVEQVVTKTYLVEASSEDAAADCLDMGKLIETLYDDPDVIEVEAVEAEGEAA